MSTTRGPAPAGESSDRYEYDRDALSPFVVTAGVPVAERYPIGYHVAQMEVAVQASRNLALVPRRPPEARFRSPRQLARLFTSLPRPAAVIEQYWKDWAFAEQRVAGPNPMVLRRVDAGVDLGDLLERAPLTNQDLRLAIGDHSSGQSLERAADEGRLFVAEYEMLEHLPGGSWSSGRKYLTAPIAYFVWRSTGQRDRGELVPLAIQLAQRADESPLFRPFHDVWRLAKLCVQIADANHHEMATHLAGTHLAVEPFAIATSRRLPAAHPVRQLLAPHLQSVIARGAEARARLIQPDGPVDTLLASSLAGSLELARRARVGYGRTRGWDIVSSGFRRHLEARGMWDRDTLPHFPYRDDGALLWDAIGSYVRDYIRVVRPTAADIAADQPLLDWMRELAAPDGGAVPGMKVVQTPEALAELLQTLVFTCGPQHAASNYPQYEFMAFAANMPLAGYGPPPSKIDLSPGVSEASLLLRMLPPFGAAVQQLITMHGLSTYRPDSLGDYSTFTFDPRTEPARRRFADDLREAEQKIDRRNAVRRWPYRYLRPSLVPNSPSV